MDLPRLRRAVGERVLIEYLELDGELHAITLHRGRLAHRRLGPALEVERERDYLLFALRRWLAVPANGSPGHRGRRRADPVPTAVAQSAARLDELLVAPLLASVASSAEVTRHHRGADGLALRGGLVGAAQPGGTAHQHRPQRGRVDGADERRRWAPGHGRSARRR